MFKYTASRVLLPIVRNAIQKRPISIISGPPTQHVPKDELFVMVMGITVLPMIYPIYILFNIRGYRQHE